jgi:transposase
VIESMNGARFVHDTLEQHGWEVLIADAQKVKGLAPPACKIDKIDARVLAELSWRDLVPAIWLPDPTIGRERDLARFRLHLVRHRTTLKNRIHATLVTFGHPCPVSDLFGLAGRESPDRRDDDRQCMRLGSRSRIEAEAGARVNADGHHRRGRI